MHHFSSERGPALIRGAGTNREIDAGTLKNDVPASISPQPPGRLKVFKEMMSGESGEM